MALTQSSVWTALAFVVCISIGNSFVAAQATQQPQNGSDSNTLGDDVTLAALVVGVAACVGVVCLSIIIVCLVSRLRKERSGMSISTDIGMVEKAPMPYQHDVTHHVVNQIPKVPRQGSVTVGVGTLRQVSLSLLQDLLLNLYNVSVKKAEHGPQRKKSVARKDSEQQIVTTTGSDEVQKQLRNGLLKIFPRDGAKVETF